MTTDPAQAPRLTPRWLATAALLCCAALAAGEALAQLRAAGSRPGVLATLWKWTPLVLFGPPRDHRILEGIRAGLLDELCARSGIPMQTRPVLREEVLAADELMVSSATKEVVAVTRLDGRPVGNGRPGPVYHALYQAYQAAKQAGG